LPATTAHQPSSAATTAASNAHGHHSVEESAGTGAGDTVTLDEALVGDALVGVAVGLSVVGVADAVVGVGVGVGVFVGVGVVVVGVGVGVGAALVGVGVALAGSVGLGVSLGEGAVSVGVAVALSEGDGVRDGIVGSDTDGRPVGSEMLPLPPHAVRSSPPVSASVATAALRRASIACPLVVAASRSRSRGVHATDRRGSAAGRRQAQRRSAGTEAITWSTCWPQPDQVILPQERQGAGRHMRTSSRRGECAENTPGGIVFVTAIRREDSRDVPTGDLPEVRQRDVGRLRPARRPGDARCAEEQAVRLPADPVAGRAPLRRSQDQGLTRPISA
jgi:hypothetical protein